MVRLIDHPEAAVGLRFAGLGACLALVAVAAGAFGAHGLRARVDPAMLAVFETAARYQMYHALALLAVGGACLVRPSRAAWLAGWLFVAGIVVFSGSLYLLVLTGIRALGAMTPIGGLVFIAGWACLAGWALSGARAARAVHPARTPRT